MFGGTLNKLLTTGGDDIAAGVVRATAKSAPKTATKLASKVDDALLNKASKYLDNADGMFDKYGLQYQTADIPVGKLHRRPEFQPRTTASGAGTEKSVFEKGYQEGLVDQPLLVRKNGDLYEVLGGHSRTSGMERRAKEGLPNPEFVKARIYEGIDDAQAKRIARAANQGGQYESTLDMAKSVHESMKEGVAPSVQKQNMTRGYSYDDYDYLWKTVQGDNIFREKLFQGAISQDDVLNVARHARTRGITPEQTLGIITGMEKNGSFTKRNAQNVMNLLAGKTKAGLMKDAQTGLFGDIDTAVNSVDLLNDFQKTQADLTRRMNSFKTVTQESGLSDDVLKELQAQQQVLQKKMNNITDEILNRYKAQNAAKPQIEYDTPQVAEGQGSMFDMGGTETAQELPKTTTKVPKKVQEQPKTNQPRKISVLKINDNTVSDQIPVSVKKYLPDLPTATPAQSTNVQPTQQIPRRRAVLELKALEQVLPDPQTIPNMSDQEFAQSVVSWRQAMANIMAIQGAMGASDGR